MSNYSYQQIERLPVSHAENRRKIFNILIADDDTNIASNLQSLLNLRGHIVNIVDDGIGCISKCKNTENFFDIVFLDYHMDGLDGAQVAEIVKDDGKKTLVFAYTGDNSDKALNEFKIAGMDGAIIKPIDIKGIDMLMNKLENSSHIDKTTINSLSRKTERSILIFDEINTQS